MHLYIAGSGKMAQAVLELQEKGGLDDLMVATASSLSELQPTTAGEAVVINFGSSQTFARVLSWCHETQMPLIEATGQYDAELAEELSFSRVIVPNLALPIIYAVKFLSPLMRRLDGLAMHSSIVESHQEKKVGVSRTALAIGREFHFPPDEIRSVRDGAVQELLGIPESDLDAHAAHWITFDGDGVTLRFSIRVSGRRAYALGAFLIARRLLMKPHRRLLAVDELFE